MSFKEQMTKAEAYSISLFTWTFYQSGGRTVSNVEHNVKLTCNPIEKIACMTLRLLNGILPSWMAAFACAARSRTCSAPRLARSMLRATAAPAGWTATEWITCTSSGRATIEGSPLFATPISTAGGVCCCGCWVGLGGGGADSGCCSRRRSSGVTVGTLSQ